MFVEFGPLDTVKKLASTSVVSIGGMKNGEWHQMALKSCIFKNYDQSSDKIFYNCPKSPSNLEECRIDNVSACELKPSEIECERK